MYSWMIAELLNLGCWGHSPQVRDIASSPTSIVWCLDQLSHIKWTVFLCKVHQALPCQDPWGSTTLGPVRGRSSSLVRWELALPRSVKDIANSSRPSYFITWFNIWFKWTPIVTWTKDINTDSSCSRMWRHHSPGGKTGHSDLYEPRRNMVLRYQHGLRGQPRPQVVTWLSTTTRATNINIVPDCGRIRNPDVGPDHKSRLGFIMAQDGSTGHFYLYGPSSTNMDGFRCQSRP